MAETLRTCVSSAFACLLIARAPEFWGNTHVTRPMVTPNRVPAAAIPEQSR